MEKNVGKNDKIIRYILAGVFLILSYMISWWFIIPAGIAFLTGFLGICGLYKLFGINTCKIK